MSDADVLELRGWVRASSLAAPEPLCVCATADRGLAVRLDPLALARRGRGMRTDLIATIEPWVTLDEAKRVVAGLIGEGARSLA